MTPAVALSLASLLFSLRLWQRGPQDPRWAPLLCLLWSIWGATLPDVDQCPGQVLRGTCQEAGPVPHQERREPGMSPALGAEQRWEDPGWCWDGRDDPKITQVLGQMHEDNCRAPGSPGSVWEHCSSLLLWTVSLLRCVWCPAGLPSGYLLGPLGIPAGLPLPTPWSNLVFPPPPPAEGADHVHSHLHCVGRPGPPGDPTLRVHGDRGVGLHRGPLLLLHHHLHHWLWRFCGR